jgi:hypothetical protein
MSSLKQAERALMWPEWFWFVAGFVYVLLGIFNYRSAMRLRLVDIQSLKRCLVSYSEEERERLFKLTL